MTIFSNVNVRAGVHACTASGRIGTGFRIAKLRGLPKMSMDWNCQYLSKCGLEWIASKSLRCTMECSDSPS